MPDKQAKYIFVTGGVLSGLGKGISAASIGAILKARGLSVNIQKLDPYLNVDAGTLNPAEHGECFVTKDGAETDLDLGHYERFLDVELTKASSVMSGRILLKLIEDERAGKFLGKTVQVVPHQTNAIQEYVSAAAEGFDVHIVEIGGTVGDYESPAFYEAIREFGAKAGLENCMYVQVVYMPYLAASKEIKTKPAQNASRDLRSMGIVPNLLIARCEQAPQTDVKPKLSAFCGVPTEGIAILPNASTVYQVPLSLEEQGIGNYITKRLGLGDTPADLNDWQELVQTITSDPGQKVRVGIVAKYLDNEDTYFSVVEAIKSAGWHNGVTPDYHWVDAEALEKPDANLDEVFKDFDGIIVPGGFGNRGVEGKIKAAQYALTNNVPYLGLCLGLQMGVIAAARLSGLAEANSVEMNADTPDPVIDTMADQKGKENTGGTMRLGNYACEITPGSKVAELYGGTHTEERHRHRYECNNDYRDKYESWGIKAVGINPETDLVEIIEGVNHPFFVASQFHPEFRSRPHRPQPLFAGFIAACKNK